MSAGHRERRSLRAARRRARSRRRLGARAARRFRSDRVGMVSLVDRRAVPAADRRWPRSAWSPRDWQAESRRARRAADLRRARRRDGSRRVARAAPSGAERRHLGDVDPLAPRYKEWDERAAQYADDASANAPTTLPFGGDRLGRDVLAKAIKGAQVSILGRRLPRRSLATLIGTLLGALAGFFGGRVGDFLEWVYNVFTVDARASC